MEASTSAIVYVITYHFLTSSYTVTLCLNDIKINSPLLIFTMLTLAPPVQSDAMELSKTFHLESVKFS